MQSTTTSRHHARSSNACNECRKRKKRCGAQQPRCSSCISKGLDCEYTAQLDRRRPPTRDYVESLQSRIQILESTIEEQASSLNRLRQILATHGIVHDILPNGANLSRASPGPKLDVLMGSSLQDEICSSPSDPDAIPDPADLQGAQFLPSKEDDIELDKVVFKLTLGDFGEPEYRGPTSSFAWSRRHDEAAGFRFPPTQTTSASPETYRSAYDTVTPEPKSTDLFLNCSYDASLVLTEISVEDMDKNLDLYFEWQNSCIPVLSQRWLHDRLYQVCALLSRSDNGASMGSLCKELIRGVNNSMDTTPIHSVVMECLLLLLAMLSIGLRFSDPFSHIGEAVFGIATTILREMCMKKPSLAIVQASCILACRAYGCGHVNNAWILNGIGATTGNIIGLHVGKGSEQLVSHGVLSGDDVEARIISYWACVILDRMLATCLGRHPLIHPDDFNTPPIPLRLASGPDSMKPNVFGSRSRALVLNSAEYEESIRNVSRLAAELWKMNDKILSDIYSFENDVANLPKEPQVLKHAFLRFSETVARFRSELFDWYRALPMSIRTTQAQPLPHTLLLQLSFHNLLILMHRPFIIEPAETLDISSYSQNVTGDTPRRYLSRTAIRASTSSAISVTRILGLFQKHYTLQSIIFIAVHFAFNASAVHVCNTRSESRAVRGRATSDLELCKNFLTEMSHTWPVALQTLADIEELERAKNEEEAAKETQSQDIFSTFTGHFTFPDEALGIWPEPMDFFTSPQFVQDGNGDSVEVNTMGSNIAGDIDLQGSRNYEDPLFNLFNYR